MLVSRFVLWLCSLVVVVVDQFKGSAGKSPRTLQNFVKDRQDIESGSYQGRVREFPTAGLSAS